MENSFVHGVEEIKEKCFWSRKKQRTNTASERSPAASPILTHAIKASSMESWWCDVGKSLAIQNIRSLGWGWQFVNPGKRKVTIWVKCSDEWWPQIAIVQHKLECISCTFISELNKKRSRSGSWKPAQEKYPSRSFSIYFPFPSSPSRLASNLWRKHLVRKVEDKEEQASKQMLQTH